MSQKHLTTGGHTNTKSQREAFNAVMKGEMELSEFVNIMRGIKKYLPSTLQDLEHFPTATAIYTDGKPLSPNGDHAILIDRQGKCWFRVARVADGKVIITVWQWPHGEATVPMNHFEAIERVSSISFERD